MKRKTSNAKCSSPLPFPRGFSGVRSSIARPNPAETHESIDFNSSRKVRFAGIDDDNVPGASSVPAEKDGAQKSNDPKTSEYAFFKKFKEKAGHEFQSRSLRRDENLSNKFKSSVSSGEATSKIDNGHQHTRSSLLSENVTRAATDNFVSMVSPHGLDQQKQVDVEIAGTTLEDTDTFQRNIDEYGQRYKEEARESYRYQYKHGQLFSRKRQKLRQWVTEISFPEIDKLCSEGHDFVSVLLGQLLPQDNDNQSFNVLKTRKPKTGSKSDFFASQNSQSDIHFKEIHHMPTSNLLEGEWVLSTNVDSSSCRMEMQRDSWLSNSHSPISLPDKTNLDDEHFDDLKRRRPKSDTESDFLTSPKSQSAIHFKEFDQMPARNLMELEWAASIDVASSSSSWMEIGKEKQLPYSHPPTSLPHKLCFDSKVRKLDYESLESITPSLSTEDNSSFGFHIEKRGSLLSNHVMELDEFGYHYPKVRKLDYESLESITPSLSTEDNSSFGFHIEKRGSLLSNHVMELDEFGYHYPKVRKLDYESLESITPSLSTEDNSSFGFHIEKRESLLSNHVMELDEFGYHYPNKLCQREPDTLMLGWDSSSVTGERIFSSRCPNTQLSLYPVSSSPQHDDEQDNCDNRIRVLREPLLLPYHPTTPPSSWCSTSASHASDNLEERLLEVKGDQVSFLNNSSLPSSPMTDHLDLAEHPNGDAMFEGTLSPQNHLWRISKFLNAEYHHSRKRAVFSPRLDFSSGQKYLPANGSPRGLFAYPALEFSSNKGISSAFLPKYENENSLDGLSLGGIFNHLRKDLIAIQHLPAISFQMSIDKETYPDDNGDAYL